MRSSTTSQPIARPEEELQYIRNIIADSRASFVEDGKPYILWGLIVAVGMGMTYLSALIQRDLYVGYIWIGLVLFGWGHDHLLHRNKKEARSSGAKFH